MNTAEARGLINPYRGRVGDFPGRLLPWVSAGDEQPVLDEIVAKSSRLYVELGSGSGGHMLEQAKRAPDSTWIGFEIRYKRAVRTLEKAVRDRCENVHVVRTDGRRLQNFFPPASVSGLYINFPDPWTKLQRRKHRMLSEDVLDSAAAVIKRGGFLSVKTDHPEYFRDFLAAVADSSAFRLEQYSDNLHRSEFRIANVLTEFEKLFLSQHLPISYLRLYRV